MFPSARYDIKIKISPRDDGAREGEREARARTPSEYYAKPRAIKITYCDGEREA